MAGSVELNNCPTFQTERKTLRTDRKGTIKRQVKTLPHTLSHLLLLKDVDEVAEREEASLEHDVSGPFNALTGQNQEFVCRRITDEPPHLKTHLEKNKCTLFVICCGDLTKCSQFK